MENIHYAISTLIIMVALFFLFIGWRRGLRFYFHDYAGNKNEKFRDNFFASVTVGTAISCVILVVTPITLWGFAVPVMLLMILGGSALSISGAYWSSFLSNLFISRKNRNDQLFWDEDKDLPNLEWYEFTPFAFFIGWIVYYLVYAIPLVISGISVTTENAPMDNILIGFSVGLVTAIFISLSFYYNRKTSGAW